MNLSRVEQNVRGFSGTMIIDAAMLFEIGLNGLCDKIIVIRCDRDTIKKRETKLPSHEVDLILQSQKLEDTLLRKADFIITNSRTLEKTKEQVKEIWNKLTKL